MAELAPEINTGAGTPEVAPQDAEEREIYRTAMSVEVGKRALGIKTTNQGGRIGPEREIVTVVAKGQGVFDDSDAAKDMRAQIEAGTPIKELDREMWDAFINDDAL